MRSPSLPQVQIRVTSHGWSVWGQIAIDHEHAARDAREKDLTTEHLSGLVAIAAAAFALDALYGVARRLIHVPEIDDGESPDFADEEHGRRRARHVADRLRRGVSPGRLAESWHGRVRELYRTRDQAVHFGEKDTEPVWHPGLQSNTSAESVAWRLEVAEAAVDLMLEVFTAWAKHPSPEVRKWAEMFTPSVVSLVETRQSGKGSG